MIQKTIFGSPAPAVCREHPDTISFVKNRKDEPMRYIPFGKTGLTVSEVGFGGIPVIRLSREDAVKVVRHAYDRGITFYDTANMYMDSEEKIGLALSAVRDRIIIATKTLRRDAAGFQDQLHLSLQRLQTDYIDLYQFHQVASDAEWEKITQPGGALEEAQKAVRTGKIRFLGVSSHNLEMAVKLAKTGLFHSIQFPFNFIEPDARKELHPYCQNHGIASIAMKPFGGGVIDNASVVFRYLRQFPDVLPIPGFDSVQAVDEIVSLYETPLDVKAEDLERMEKYRQELGLSFCRRCEYCQPCPRGVMITPAMGYPVIAHRMSPDVSVQFSKVPMESTLLCDQCGTCIEKCPYDLPIPEILKRNYDLYETHRSALGLNDKGKTGEGSKR